MENLKPFDPDDIEESLLRFVTHGGKHYAFFPYIDALGSAPELKSVRHLLKSGQITIAELSELSAIVKKRADNGAWFISFSTPWLIARTEVDNVGRRPQSGTRAR